MLVEMLTGMFPFYFPSICVKLHFDGNEMQHFKVTSYVKLC